MSNRTAVIEKPKKTFENVEAKPLTSGEREKLSKEVIVGWYKAQRLEKLKALQDEIVSMTLSEREEMKEKIRTNTKKELEKEKELTATEKEKRAEQFADDVLKVADGMAHIEKIAERYNEQAEQEKMFYAHLKKYAGKDNEKRLLQKLANEEQVKSAIGAIKNNDPALGKKIDVAIKDGDMEEFKKLLSKGSESVGIINFSPDDVEQFCASSILGDIGFKTKTGWGAADKLLNGWDKFRKVGHSYVLRKCVKDMSTDEMKIPYMLVLHLSNLSVRELKQMDTLMQSKKYLIENKEKQSALDLKRLKFIEVLHHFKEKLEQKIIDKKIDTAYPILLRKYLEQKKLPSQEIDKIVLNSKVDDLKVLHVIDIAYEPQGREGEWFVHALSRSKTMWKAYRAIFSESADIKRTYALYHYNRLVHGTLGEFKKNAKGWGMDPLMKEMDKLEQRAAVRPQADMDAWEKEKVMDKEMLHHDNTVKEYHILAQRASTLMTQKAKELYGLTQSIEAVKKAQLSNFFTTKLESMRGADIDGILKQLHPEKTADELAGLKRTMSGADLMRAYAEKAIDFRTMQDTTRARFAVLSNNIEKGIGQFRQEWENKLDVEKENYKEKEWIKSYQK